ncbi:MAG: fumarylacetoacetate hydrolase family protein [Leucobacter sp.]
MALASYRIGDETFVGVVDGDHFLPLPGISRIDADTDVDALLAAAPDLGGRVARAEVELLPPSWAPQKVFCVGLNYNEHILETGRELPEYPVLFPKYASSLIAADAPIAVPPESSQVDYEAELAIVIGKPGRRIAKERALEHVLGYTVANDVTMRDYQYRTHQWLQGKAWDGSTPIGPHLVLPHEVDLSRARIRTIVNGATEQESDLSKLIFDVATLISIVSEFTALATGDLILSGTPGGVGYRRKPQLFLTPGTEVTVEVEGVGRIDSIVVAE